MTGLLDLSAAMIDSGEVTSPPNRVTNTLSELGDDLAVVESFSHIWALRTADGLVVFDASSALTGAAVTAALRGWTTDPVHTLVYTHGHVDHVGGSGFLVADGRSRGHRDPRVLGHANIPPRLARYELTDGYNSAINARQFGGVNPSHGLGLLGAGRFLPATVAHPTDTYHDRFSFRVGDLDVHLHHAKGETDDHTWAWIPSLRAVAVGDFITWVFPNAGNPQKVQRYPSEWAAALREMAALEPALLLPAHGLPIAGRARIASVLDRVAGALETLVREVLDRMNAGQGLDAIVAEVRLGADVLALPYLRPLYDEPEFVVRNIWRLYGGWWDGNAARLKPPADAVIAAEVAALAGGVPVLVARAADAAGRGDLRLACQLVEWAVQADPGDLAAHGARADIYAARRRAESSLMAKGVFAAAARESAAAADRPDPV